MRGASIRHCSPASLKMSVDVVTFGCRLNAFESEVIAREAERAGLTDTIVINSCAVTNEAVAQARQSIDRKSTRLNSSHQIISYAVFCLKKKKRKKTYDTLLDSQDYA